MGNFLIVLPSNGHPDEAGLLFHTGLAAARQLKAQNASRRIELPWARAATFPRRNESGSSVVVEEATGNWLLSIGTWFHPGGWKSGNELGLLKRYQEIGATRLARELEGFFVIVLGDSQTRDIFVLTDLVGSCHGFYRQCKNALALSGSSLLLASLDKFHLDSNACQEFLALGCIYEDRSLFTEVRKLAPASVYRFQQGGLQAVERYWRISQLHLESRHGPAAAQALWESLTGAAKRIQDLFARPVCDLTGGYDSRALVAAFYQAGLRFSTVVSGPAESRDVVVSRGLARMAGLPHLHMPPPTETSLDELRQALCVTDGEYDLVEYARIQRIHQTLAQQFDGSLNGSFGEVARGFWWEVLAPETGARRPLDSRRVARKRYVAQPFDASLFPPETRIDMVSHMAGVINRAVADLTHLPNTAQMDQVYLLVRMQRWQGRIASSTNQIWPCLSPFILRPVLEVMLETQARFRRRSLLVRMMLATMAPRWAEFPLEHGYPAIPASAKNFYRFWPLGAYYGNKILSRASRLTGIRWGSSATSAHTTPPRLQLWSQEDVHSLLKPTTMRIASHLDPAALSNFLARSRESGFSFSDQWARLLSLECTLRALDGLSPDSLSYPRALSG